MTYRLPTRNASRLPQVAQRKGYMLEKAEPAPQVVQPRPPFRVSHVAPGDARHGYTPGPQRAPVTRQRFQVDAPRSELKALARLNLLVATEDNVPDFFGEMRLKLDNASVDLNRVASGIMNLHRNHVTDVPIGRIASARIEGSILFATAEVADVPEGRDFLTAFDQGLSRSVSPGFIIHEVSVSETDGIMLTTVTRLEVYEISCTSIGRNKRSIARRLSMSANAMPETPAMPELLTTSDLTGLSLALGRRVLRENKITDSSKRAKMIEFFRVFDAAAAAGVGRDAAVARAKSAAGIPA